MKASVPLSPCLSWTVLRRGWQLSLVLPFTSKYVSVWMMDFVVTLLNIKVRAVQLKGKERKRQKTPIFIPEATHWRWV